MSLISMKYHARGISVLLLLALLASPFSGLAAPGDLTRVSVDSNGAQANGRSYGGQLSGDGRFVAFASGAPNLVSGDTNNVEDIFVKDRLSGLTIRASVASITSAQGNSDSGGTLALSSDGRFVAFESNATNLVGSDTNGQSDVFIRDLQSGVTTLVSVDSAGVQANDISESVSISGDGRVVAFTSSATNLVGGDTNAAGDVFVRNLQTGTTIRASVDSTGVQGNGESFSPKISVNGRYVVFSSNSTNLVGNDTNGVTDIFVHDLQSGQTTRESVNSSGAQLDKQAEDSSISGDGRFVTFSTVSENILGEDTYGFEQVYIHDRLSGTTTLVSRHSAGYPMQGRSDASAISADGRYIAFSHDDRGDGMPDRWIFIHDRQTGQTLRASPVYPIRPSLSADGRFLVYDSTNALVAEDTNGDQDVFVKEMVYPPDVSPTVISIQPACSGSFCNYPTGPLVSFRVTFSEFVTGVTADDFLLNMAGGISGASVAGITGGANQYLVNVNTGTGDGTLRMEVIDNDSIQDVSANPLGGVGTSNGNFTAVELYIIDNNIPVVISILRTDTNPTAVDAVHYIVNFSEQVNGLDLSDFAVSTTGGIVGATVTELGGSGNTYMVTASTGSGDGSLSLTLLDNDSIVDQINNPLGGVGAGNGNFTTGEQYTVNKYAPFVTSILRADPNPTTAQSVHYTVTFSEVVGGVDAGDFAVATSGNVAGTSILEVNGAGSVYSVTVNTGTGPGSLRLHLLDNDSIMDAGSLPLGGAGAGNGNFSTGEEYSISKIPANLLTATFNSNGANDGWILESSEDSNQGGSKNSNNITFRLGDDLQDRQYRAILHFPTYVLPDNAVITEVVLMIKKQEVSGTNPFTTHQNIAIDIRTGVFGNLGPFGINSLQVSDYQNPASLYSAGIISNSSAGGWYIAALDGSANQFINLRGMTQFRLAFQLDDNDDLGDDFLTFYSGNYDSLSERPHLVVKYYLLK